MVADALFFAQPQLREFFGGSLDFLISPCQGVNDHLHILLYIKFVSLESAYYILPCFYEHI